MQKTSAKVGDQMSSIIRGLITLVTGVLLFLIVLGQASQKPILGSTVEKKNEWKGIGTTQTEYFEKTSLARLRWSANSGDSPNSLQVEVVDINEQLESTPVIAEGTSSGLDAIGGNSRFVSLRFIAGRHVEWRVILEDTTTN